MAITSVSRFSDALPSYSLLCVQNPFKGISQEELIKKLNGDRTDLGHRRIDRSYTVITWEPSVARQVFESVFSPAKVLDFFKGTDVKVVADSVEETALNEIRAGEAKAVYYLYEKIAASETSIAICETEPGFKAKALQCIQTLLTRPSGRVLLLALASSALPVRIHSSTRFNQIFLQNSHVDIEVNLDKEETIIAKKEDSNVITSTPPYIILAHEMIHACHFVADSQESHTTISAFLFPVIDGFSNLEEKRTIIGMPGVSILCENSLYFEFNRLPRVFYLTPDFPSSESLSSIHSMNSMGRTALMMACEWGLLTEVAKLVKVGANPNEGLFFALNHRYLEIFNYLLENGADTDSYNKKGDSLLSYAVKINFPQAIRSAVRHGAKVDKKDSRGNTPLLIAIEKSYHMAAQALVESKANVNAQNRSKLTPLMAAVKALDAVAVKLLLENGAFISRDVKKRMKWLSQHPHSYSRQLSYVQLVFAKHKERSSSSSRSYSPGDLSSSSSPGGSSYLLALSCASSSSFSS